MEGLVERKDPGNELMQKTCQIWVDRRPGLLERELVRAGLINANGNFTKKAWEVITVKG